MSPDVLRIFVSSPGDVGEERVMTERVVQRLQGEFGHSVKLQPILWEHEPMRATQHPQEQIPLPSECDIVVCLLWSRLGTRLPDQISAAGKTGTEWEFEEAARSFLAKKIPDLLVYRKTKEVLASVDDAAAFEEKNQQRTALNAFLIRWFRSEDGTFKAVFKTFDALDQFEELLERDLRKLIQDRLKLTPIAEKTWHHAPFRGLEVFDFEHAPIFFGRTRAIGAIREALVQQAAHGCAFVLVFGMSGVGKSSLVRAGVLPTITQPGVIEGVGLWRWCVFRPSDATGDLCDGLASALMAAQALPELAEAGVDARALAKLLREAPDQAALPLSVGLKRAAETTAATERLLKPPVTRLALVVDQMEELFSSDGVTEPQRIGFVQALSALARSGHVWIIGTMRSDFYPRCAEVPELAALKAGAGQFDLLPPTAPQLAQMIGDPARAAGLRFEEKPTGERLDHVLQETALRDPQALPLLEFTLAELYKLCLKDKPPSEAVVLTFAAYDQLGGMEGALARRAEEEFAKLPANVQAGLPAVFRALVTVRQGEDEAIVAQPVLREVFAAAADQNALVEAFIQARLFVSDRTSVEQKAMVRLAHEALLRCWPRLVQWLAANREFLRIRARVSEEAKRWQSEGRLPELLLAPGKPLAEGEFLLSQQKHELDPDVRLGADVLNYIELSRRSAARKRRRRQMITTAFVVTLLLGAVLSSFFAWQTRKQLRVADDEKRRAQLRLFNSQLYRVEMIYQSDPPMGLALLHDEECCPTKDRDFTWGLYNRWCRRDRLTLKGHTAYVSSVVFSPDGKTLASASGDKTVKLWDAVTGQERTSLKGHTAGVSAVCFSPDGKTLASGSWDGTVKLWDVQSGQERASLKGHTHTVHSVCFSPDGNILASGSGDDTIKLWDAQSGQDRATLKGHTGWVMSVRFSPDGKTLASASGDKTVKLWDAVTGQERTCLKGHTGWVHSVCFSPGGKTLASAGDKTIKFWDAQSGQERSTLKGHTDDVYCVVFSSDGTTVASCSLRGGEIKLWDAQSGQERVNMEVRLSTPWVWRDAKTGQKVGTTDLDWVNSVCFSPDGKTLASGNGCEAFGPGEIRLWDTRSGQERTSLKGHTGTVYSVCFSPDGKTLASASGDKTVRLWDAVTGQERTSLKGHTGTVYSVCFSPDGNTLASSSYDDTIKLWDAGSGQERASLMGHTGTVNSVCFSPDGKTLASAGDKTLPSDRGRIIHQPGEIKLWDAQSGQARANLTGHPGEVTSLCFSPDGKTLASAGGAWPQVVAGETTNAEIKLWDVRSGQERATLIGHTHRATSVCFSPDGKTLASASKDKTVKLWDAVTGQERTSLKGHTAGVNAVCFSPDGKALASGSSDDTIKLWDAVTGQERATIKGHTGWVSSLCFSPNGMTLASGSGDGTIKLWAAENGQ